MAHCALNILHVKLTVAQATVLLCIYKAGPARVSAKPSLMATGCTQLRCLQTTSSVTVIAHRGRFASGAAVLAAAAAALGRRGLRGHVHSPAISHEAELYTPGTVQLSNET